MKESATWRDFAEDARGAVLVEFAFLAPVLIMAMVGVFHIAFYMQNYNALRSVASDAARRVMIESQKDNTLSSDEISAVTRSIAVSAPYLLKTDNFDATVSQVGTSRVTGTTELTLSLSYTGVDFLPFASVGALTMTYQRPIFIITPAPTPAP